MQNSDILKQVNNIIIEVLDNDNIVLSEKTTADDVEEWDSLTNIHIIFAIEKHFSIKFTSKEMQDIKNVGELIDHISKKYRSK
ncbi:MAG: acyl carrier protein [Bacteroidales bacterium]